MPRNRFISPEIVRLPLSDGDWIDVKKELNAGEARRVFTKLVKTMHAGEKAELNPEDVGKTKLVEYLIGWSFIDQDGRPSAYSPEALDDLEPDTYNEIAKAIETHEEAAEKARAERKNTPAIEMPSPAISS